jgi:hypothetical protein
VGFLCHFDVHACGFADLIQKLKRRAGRDLTGFEIGVVTAKPWWLYFGVPIGLAVFCPALMSLFGRLPGILIDAALIVASLVYLNLAVMHLYWQLFASREFSVKGFHLQHGKRPLMVRVVSGQEGLSVVEGDSLPNSRKIFAAPKDVPSFGCVRRVKCGACGK